MSWRTLIELNHDYGREIARDPQGFLEALKRFTNSANPETASDLERFGFLVSETRHHSEPYINALKVTDR